MTEGLAAPISSPAVSAPLSIRPNVHYCRIGDAYVFLDIGSDRYSMLDGKAASRFDRFLYGRALADDLDWLKAHGLLCEGKPTASRVADSLKPATSSLVDLPLERAGLVATAACLLQQRAARREISCRPLVEIMADIERTQRGFADPDDDTCRGVTAAFLRARHYVSAIDQCLVRGLAMKRYLLHRRCSASLVFGVALPFSAHCWVQAGSTVLTDPLDTVRPFHPIFAV